MQLLPRALTACECKSCETRRHRTATSIACSSSLHGLTAPEQQTESVESCPLRPCCSPAARPQYTRSGHQATHRAQAPAAPSYPTLQQFMRFRVHGFRIHGRASERAKSKHSAWSACRKVSPVKSPRMTTVRRQQARHQPTCTDERNAGSSTTKLPQPLWTRVPPCHVPMYVQSQSQSVPSEFVLPICYTLHTPHRPLRSSHAHQTLAAALPGGTQVQCARGRAAAKADGDAGKNVLIMQLHKHPCPRHSATDPYARAPGQQLRSRMPPIPT